MRGIRIKIAKKLTWKIMDKITVHGLLVLTAFEVETTISSNMSYDLPPAGARRPEAPSLPRALLPAAGPALAACPRPRQLTQATTSGAAIPKLEYVPTTIPTTRAKEKARNTCPPIRKSTSTVRNVRPLVRMVRDSV